MRRADWRFALAIPLLLSAPAAQALCLDPQTWESGYHRPLAVEVFETPAIVIGTVTGVRYLQEDRSDPYGITHYLYDVYIGYALKGHPPSRITLKVANGSGSYRMSAWETHLLFLTLDRDGGYQAWLCGNSAQFPAAEPVMRQVESLLGSGRQWYGPFLPPVIPETQTPLPLQEFEGSYPDVRARLLGDGWSAKAETGDLPYPARRRRIPLDPRWPELTCSPGADAVCDVCFVRDGRALFLFVDRKREALPVFPLEGC